MRNLLSACALAGASAACQPPAVLYVPPPAYPANVTAATLPPFDGGYRLPVIGRWRVHRTHYDLVNDQATAVDLVIDKPHPQQKTGHANNEFPSYGQPIVADGPGVIAIAVDGVPDNDVPSMNGYQAHGNFVVIDHKNGDYSLFAHLVPGTIAVRAGQVVAMGQEIARCGNSGHSSMAHLHYQMMDHAMPNLAHARAIRHAPYLKNGKPTTERMESRDVIEAMP